MATLTIPYSFNPSTAIVASEMNSNFATVKSFVESLAAGTNIDTGAIESSKLATSTIQLLTPTGSITQYAGSSLPTGWLLCDGSAISRTTYSALFAVIGTAFGSGDGSTTFNLPNLKGRVPVGRDATQTEFDVLGESGGTKTHTLVTAEMPTHRHTISEYIHSVTQNNALGGHSHTADGDLAAAGSGYHGHTAGSGGVDNHAHDTPMLTMSTSDSTTHRHTRDDFYSAASGVYTWVNYSKQTNGAGAHSHTVSVDANGSHTHDVTGSTSSVDLAHGHSVGVGNHAAKDTADTGGSGAHNNLQPYLVLNYIIKI